MYRPGWSALGNSFHAEFAAPRGLPIRACTIGTDAALGARYIRSRFTVIDLEQDLGLG